MAEILITPKSKKGKLKVKGSVDPPAIGGSPRKEKKKKKDEVKTSTKESKDKKAKKKATKKKDGEKKKGKTTRTKKADVDLALNETEPDLICCICQNPETNACCRGGRCEHVYCVECLERIVSRPMPNPTELDCHLGCPTLGRCPVPTCGKELRLFE